MAERKYPVLCSRCGTNLAGHPSECGGEGGQRQWTRDEAVQQALDWAEGRRSWTNLGHHAPYTPDVIAVMDAQEVVKWSALAAVLPVVVPAPAPDVEVMGRLTEAAALLETAERDGYVSEGWREDARLWRSALAAQPRLR